MILALCYKMCLVVSVQALYQFNMKPSARASIASSLTLAFMKALHLQTDSTVYFIPFHLYLTVWEYCRIRQRLYIRYFSLMIPNFIVSCADSTVSQSILSSYIRP